MLNLSICLGVVGKGCCGQRVLRAKGVEYRGVEREDQGDGHLALGMGMGRVKNW